MYEKKALVSGFYTPLCAFRPLSTWLFRGVGLHGSTVFFCSYHYRHGDAKGTRMKSFARAVHLGTTGVQGRAI